MSYRRPNPYSQERQEEEEEESPSDNLHYPPYTEARESPRQPPRRGYASQPYPASIVPPVAPPANVHTHPGTPYSQHSANFDHDAAVPPAGTYPFHSTTHEPQEYIPSPHNHYNSALDEDAMDLSNVDHSGYLHPDTGYHGVQYNPYMAGSANDLTQEIGQRPHSHYDTTTLLPPHSRPERTPTLPPTPYEEQHHYLGGFQGGRVQSFISSGQSLISNNKNEYEEDPFGHIQVPLVGDSYALNTVEEAEEDPDDDRTLQDREEAPARVVNLFRGNLVLDCPISQRLMEKYPDHQPAREFTHMRYSAATCDPEDFLDDQFTLRQVCYSSPRKTELVIAITIYNEDDILLARTLQGVFNNIRHLSTRTRSPIWGAEAWKKVVVVIVADGRSKINPRARALLAALGCFQEGLAKNVVNDKDVVAHLYEYTTMMRVKKVTDTVTLTSDNATPVQMIFCLKEKNQKKINSHRWLFQALSPILDPNVVVLLDAGTRPGNKAIYHLWKRFDRDAKVAGACGEIAAMLGAAGGKLFNPIVAAQNFEYKMSNILDKPTESVFGFITVLPGAFSAYRYEALLNDENGQGPLEKYFKGEKLEATGGIFESNMYLAEDRILCWALVAKRDCDWKLTYVKSAVAHTDVPETLSELVLQRRRWLNGSFFAAIYAQVYMFQIWRTSHSVGRKLLFHLEFLFQFIQLVFSWFSLANFFLVFKILANSLSDTSLGFAPGHILSVVLTYLYGACVIATFVLGMGNRPQGTRTFYLVLVIFFAIMMAYVMFAAIYVAVKSIQYEICIEAGFQFKFFFTNSTFRDLLVALLSTYLLYLVSSVMMLDPWHMVTSMLQYVLMSPTYVNVFNVYAFCNTHDISWGTKGDTTVKHDLGVVQANEDGKIEVNLPTSSEEVDAAYINELKLIELPDIQPAKKPSAADARSDYYAAFRSSVVLVWGFMNIALVAIVLNIGVQKTDTLTGQTLKRAASVFLEKRDCTKVVTASSNTVSVYLTVIMWSVAITAAFKFVCCFIFMCQRLRFHCCCTSRRKSYSEKV